MFVMMVPTNEDTSTIIIGQRLCKKNNHQCSRPTKSTVFTPKEQNNVKMVPNTTYIGNPLPFLIAQSLPYQRSNLVTSPRLRFFPPECKSLLEHCMTGTATGFAGRVIEGSFL